MKKISGEKQRNKDGVNLAYLDCKERLRKIIEIHPILVYFICNLGNSVNFKLDSRVMNRQEDCRKLSYLDITSYLRPSERTQHTITGMDCQFTTSGKKIFYELSENDICRKIVERCDFRNRDSFDKSFKENFTFKIDPNKAIQLKLDEIYIETCVKLARNNYTFKKNGIRYKISYIRDSEKFRVKIEIQCICKENTAIEVEENDLLCNLKSCKPFILQCNSCEKLIYVSHNLYHILSI